MFYDSVIFLITHISCNLPHSASVVSFENISKVEISTPDRLIYLRSWLKIRNRSGIQYAFVLQHIKPKIWKLQLKTWLNKEKFGIRFVNANKSSISKHDTD